MEFGRVPTETLMQIDFRLPVEPAQNKRILVNAPQTKPDVYLGCAKWGRKEWVGKIYPPKTPEKKFLDHYVQHYNCIELNATHYKLYGRSGIAAWAEKAAGKDFLFCPKMYQGITHRGSLLNKQFQLGEFFRGIAGFEAHLGPVLVQLNEFFSPKRREELYSFLGGLPKENTYYLELRHPDWFAQEPIWQELLEKLTAWGIGLVITDTSGRRDCAHMHLTIPGVFIRYVGNSLHPTDYTRIDDWINRMQYWLQQGIQHIYFFMHMHDETFSPELTVYMVDKLNATCGLQLIKPKFIDKQATLFGE